MYVLDTDIITLMQFGSGAEYELVNRRLDTTAESVYTTVVSLEEQFRGRLAVCRRATRPTEYVAAAGYLRRTFDYYRTKPILDFDTGAATEYSRFKGLKLRIGTADLRIAAIVLANNATLITRNLSDFHKVPRLRAEDWSRP